MKLRATAMTCLALLSACVPISREAAADRCEDRARAAQAPEAEVQIGTNSRTGAFVNGSIGISSDFIRGSDPLAVYQSCVVNLTGEPPIRPPVLRDL